MEQNEKTLAMKILETNLKWTPKKLRKNKMAFDDIIVSVMEGNELHESKRHIKEYKRMYKYIRKGLAILEEFGISNDVLHSVEQGNCIIPYKGLKKYQNKLIKKYAKKINLHTLPKQPESLNECLIEIEKVVHIKKRHKTILLSAN